MFKTDSAFVACLVFALAASAAASTVDIREERGVYQLNFESTYQTYIHNDIEICVTIPKGYEFTGVMPGSPDFLSVEVFQNRMYVSKATPEIGVMTNLSVHVLTAEKLEKELFFKLKSDKNAPRVLAIQFEKANYSELNATLEAMKARYGEQLTTTLAEQQKVVTKETKANTMLKCRQWFIKSRHGGVEVENKGATARLMGIINFEGSSYIYIEGIARQGDCEVVSLEEVEVDGQKRRAELLGGSELDGGPLSMLVYSIPQVDFKIKRDKYRSRKWKLVLKVWSEIETVKFKAQ